MDTFQNEGKLYSAGYNVDHNDFERMAVQRAIDIVSNYGRRALIYTDSQYVLQHMSELKSGHGAILQRVDGHSRGIQEAHKLANSVM